MASSKNMKCSSSFSFFLEILHHTNSTLISSYNAISSMNKLCLSVLSVSGKYFHKTQTSASLLFLNGSYLTFGLCPYHVIQYVLMHITLMELVSLLLSKLKFSLSFTCLDHQFQQLGTMRSWQEASSGRITCNCVLNLMPEELHIIRFLHQIQL